jgi:hypothetical protein
MTSTKAILKHERKVERLSVNSMLLTPAKLRWFALGELWWYRACWRLPVARGIMQRERSYEMREMLPILVVLGIVAGVTIFVVLPSTLQEQSATLLSSLWPLWVVQVVPMICAQAMAMQNAPNIAIRLTEAELQGDFDMQDIAKHSAQAAHAAVPLIFAQRLLAGAVYLVLWSVGGLGAGSRRLAYHHRHRVCTRTPAGVAARSVLSMAAGRGVRDSRRALCMARHTAVALWHGRTPPGPARDVGSIAVMCCGRQFYELGGGFAGLERDGGLRVDPRCS